jgi:hypothetical protein
MNFLVSIFSSEKSSISATGSWQIAAGSTDEAIGFAKHCADPRLWPPGSTWSQQGRNSSQAAQHSDEFIQGHGTRRSLGKG